MAHDILKNDCAFYTVTNKVECTALSDRHCKGCAFRKTEEELIEGRRKATQRLSRLPHDKFNKIMLKYYRFNKFNGDTSSEGESED